MNPDEVKHHKYRVTCLHRLDLPNLAEAELKRSIEVDASSVRTQFFFGYLLAERKEFKQAMEHLRIGMQALSVRISYQ